MLEQYANQKSFTEVINVESIGMKTKGFDPTVQVSCVSELARSLVRQSLSLKCTLPYYAPKKTFEN